MNLCKEALNSSLEQGKKYVLAVSGWVDSMVLLHTFLSLYPKEQCIVAHFDHQLRWSESDGDRELVEKVCSDAWVHCEVRSVSIASEALNEKTSIESIARKYRYEFFSELFHSYSAEAVLTAHHADDRIETMCFNLLRWSKLGGIHALKKENTLLDETRIIRPFLSLEKEILRKYAREFDVLFREDTSNQENTYLRNRIRNNILPEFSSINREYKKACLNFIEYTESLQDWIDENIQIWFMLQGCKGDNLHFSVQEFIETHSFLQKEIIRYIFEKTNHGSVGLSEGNIEEILRFIKEAEGNTYKHIKKLYLSKEKGRINIISK